MSAPALIPVTTNPHFDRLGGEPAVRRLVDAFYAAMQARDDARAVRSMHAADLSATKAVLVLYLTEWLGGPKRYTPARGAPRLRRVHQPFAIDAAARDAWLACMQQALEQTSDDAELKASLLAAFSRIAEHIENTQVPLHHRSP